MDERELRGVADRLDVAILGAAGEVDRMPAGWERERYLDLLTGLVHAVDAARALADGEPRGFQDRAASFARYVGWEPPGLSRRAGET